MKFDWKGFRAAIKGAITVGNGNGSTTLPLRDLGKLCGISAPTLSRLLNGKKIDLDSAIGICGGLKLEIGNYIKKK